MTYRFGLMLSLLVAPAVAWAGDYKTEAVDKLRSAIDTCREIDPKTRQNPNPADAQTLSRNSIVFKRDVAEAFKLDPRLKKMTGTYPGRSYVMPDALERCEAFVKEIQAQQGDAVAAEQQKLDKEMTDAAATQKEFNGRVEKFLKALKGDRRAIVEQEGGPPSNASTPAAAAKVPFFVYTFTGGCTKKYLFSGNKLTDTKQTAGCN